MGSDLAVCIVDGDLTAHQVARLAAVTESDAHRIFLMVGQARPTSAGRPFFAMWADERVDLRAVCADLSTKARVCVAWKSEHGGVGGYLAYESGQEVANESETGGDYLYLPSKGVERVLGVDLRLVDHARLGFPDVLLGEGVNCFEIDSEAGTINAAPPETVRRLLEEEFDVEPVLPVDVW